jgi:hypothetical protein
MITAEENALRQKAAAGVAAEPQDDMSCRSGQKMEQSKFMRPQAFGIKWIQPAITLSHQRDDDNHGY